jgi:hypothetical protein
MCGTLAMDQSRWNPNQKDRIAGAVFALAVGFANLSSIMKIPPAPFCGPAACEQGSVHHFKMGAVFEGKTDLGHRSGVHLRCKIASGVLLFRRLRHPSELHESGLADGRKQIGLVF